MTMAKSVWLQSWYGARPLVAAVLTVSALAGSAHSAFSQDSVLPADARTMTAFEIYRLYKNKSWQWDDGAGLMEDAGRKFSASGDGEKGKFRAEGRWVISDTGLMCLKATWHTGEGAFPAKTCFSHKINGKTIYQKREPDGEWYVFRHADPRENDAASKLIAADLVSQPKDDIQATLGTSQSVEQ